MTTVVTSIIPLFLMIIYLAGIGFIIWFAINLINVQKERNVILKDIYNKLDGISSGKKEE